VIHRSHPRIRSAYRTLLDHHGPQRWWPAETPFEVIVGAVLVQNTAWKNVERAIANLRGARALDVDAMLTLPEAELAQLIRPAGYFNVKAKRLRHLVEWYRDQGGTDRLKYWSTARLREALLAVHGVGRETADDILLYVFHRPVFVVDAYTRRLYERLGVIDGDEGYESLRQLTEAALAHSVPNMNEWHALIVAHSKDICRPKPLCHQCPLRADCAYAN
jgi:endonuclease-3 related protein